MGTGSAPDGVEVVAVGHAIVDVLASATDEKVASLGLVKGTMTLVDGERAARIHDSLGPTTASSGGSAANTAAALASLGARVAFVGNVGDDRLGAAFGADIRASGVEYSVPPATAGAGTGRCLVMVTPDAERTMATSLGTGGCLGPADVDAALFASCRLLYVEGYLCGLESTQAAMERALAEAVAGGAQVALSLSDPYWVDSHRAGLEWMLERADVVFANEAEALGMAGVSDLGEAVRVLARRCPTVVVTQGAGGAMVAGTGHVVHVGAESVDPVVDTTGAGDLFAAGYLFGHLRGLGPARSARLGARCAAEIISHYGARPLVSLAGLVPAVDA
ncbi:MAG: adenosine kinase [Acidimicrobiales bacterium]